jgi:hypothetical protein
VVSISRIDQDDDELLSQGEEVPRDARQCPSIAGRAFYRFGEVSYPSLYIKCTTEAGRLDSRVRTFKSHDGLLDCDVYFTPFSRR